MLITVFFELLHYIFSVFLIKLDHLKAEVTILDEVFLLSLFPDCCKIFNRFKSEAALLKSELAVLS